MIRKEGVTKDGHVRGGRSTEVIYLVDGLPVQDVIGGGLGSDVPKSSIVHMTVQTGGFDAEYGNAQSGVVNVVSKSGGDSHRFAVRGDYDHLLPGEETNRTAEVEASLSGPVLRKKLYYYIAQNVFLSDTRWWQDLGLYFDSPIQRDYDGFAKVDYHIGPSGRLTTQLLYSLKRWRDYEFSWRFNLGGLPARSRDSYRVAAFWTHTMSPESFYTVSLSRFALNSRVGEGEKNEVDTTPYEYDFFLKYVVRGKRAWWAESRQTIYTLKADWTTVISRSHLLKAGAEINFYSVFGDILKTEPQKTFYGKPKPDAPPFNFSHQYRYSPRVYLQDKIQTEPEGMIVNIGLRYDFLDPRASRPAIELIPRTNEEFQQEVKGSVPARFKSQFSPRLGIASPAGQNWYLYVNYGVYFQYPLFEYLYSGLNPVSLAKTVPALLGNPDLEPERTTLIPSKTRIAGDYGFAEFVNSPEAFTNGFEVVIARERGKFVTGSLSYTLMKVKGLSDFANQGLRFFEWGFPLFPELYPLSWDQRHTVKLIADIDFPMGLSANVIAQYHSGRPYTFFPTKDGFTPLDSTMIFTPNNARMNNTILLDVKIVKGFSFGSSKGTWMWLYVDARNLLDRKNVLWSDSNGRVGGELGDPSAYDELRRLKVGLTVKF